MISNAQNERSVYDCQQVAKLLNISEATLRQWDRISVLRERQSKSLPRKRYTFSDLVSLKTTKTLSDQGVPLRRIQSAARALAKLFPEATQPLSKFRLIPHGSTVLVKDQNALYEPETGQLVFDFDDVDRTHVASLVTRRERAYKHYLKACALDDDAQTWQAAEDAYRRALELNPKLAVALTNLGNLRHRMGDAAGAEALYLEAIEADAQLSEARYNFGVLLYEQGRFECAVEKFKDAVRLDPKFADAHFNLAMALETIGHGAAAQVYWNSYLELDPEGPWATVATWHLKSPADAEHPFVSN